MDNLIKYNKIIENEIDMKKQVNCSCFCSKSFGYNDKLLYILPCCHIVHENCFNDYIIKEQYKNLDIKNRSNNNFNLNCPNCNSNIETILNETKINNKAKYHQYLIDIKSVKIDNSAHINYTVLPFSMIKFTSLINKLVLINSEQDIINTIEYIIKMSHIKINVIDNTKVNPIQISNNKIVWKKIKDNKQKIVLISNHAHYLDSVIYYYLFRCGFVSSDFINRVDIGRIIASKMNLLIFKRGSDTNMVDKIKTYLNDQKRILIYPEGMITNNDTIMRFRTGAFYVGETICPIVIKYDKVIYSDDFQQMIFKLITQNEIVVNVYINDFYYPPYDEQKIESIRNTMAKIGNFEKSRVSNKSLKE